MVGWAISERRTAELAVDALAMASKQRRPVGGVIHHADHGSQYTSIAFCDAAHHENDRLCFAQTGTRADNAAAGAFLVQP